MIEQLKKIQFQTSSLFNNERVAVALTAFNRPQLFSIVVDSINSCEELLEVPIFLFLDGGRNSLQQENLEIFKKLTFKNKYVIKRNVNYGCEKNTIDAFETIFTHLDFDFCFLIEDDHRLGKNYFKYCYDKFKQIANFDKKIGLYQGYTHCLLPVNEKYKVFNDFQLAGGSSHWSFMISKFGYQQIKDQLEEYFQIIYSLQTNGLATQELSQRRLQITNCFDKIIENTLQDIPKDLKDTYYKRQNAHCVLGWDGAFLLAEACAGINRYMPVVNRMINIGKEGLHFNESLFNACNLDKMTLDEVWL